ncbi:MAG: asparaginase [Firmicutes bacterium]|nr:asparaginase [Bacillota bacterium]
MKRILVINTGGTFSSRPSDHGLAPSINGDEILSLLGDFDPSVLLDWEDYASLDSSNILPEDWQGLANRIGQAVNQQNTKSLYDGIVLIHGTDTMAYTASMLSFMLQGVPLPVVVTGSQLPIGVPMSDAVDNCRCAIQMAASGMAGVYIAFDRKVMLGCRASKVRTLSFQAFESINYPYVGEVNALGLNLNTVLPCDWSFDASLPSTFQPNTKYSTRIAVLKLFPGMHPEIFSFLQAYGYQGIYIEGFGLGGVPFREKDFTAEIDKASKAGMSILVGSQCRYEGSNLNIYETGQRVLACGGIPVHDMTQESVVTKLMWCLGQTSDRKEIEAYFSQNLVGEVTLP